MIDLFSWITDNAEVLAWPAVALLSTVLPPAKANTAWALIRTVLDIAALNFGKAKNANSVQQEILQTTGNIERRVARSAVAAQEAEHQAKLEAANAKTYATRAVIDVLSSVAKRKLGTR